MKGSVYTFMGSMVMVMIGVGIIWWFRSVIPSEAFIVSERHRESFSAINYAELARKTLEEAVAIYTQTGATKAGAAGGLDNTVPQKDKIAIWKTAPGEATIKDTLKRYIVDEIASLQQHPIVGKFLTTDYGDTNIQIIPDNPDFSKSEKFYVKGDKEIKVSKGLKTQAISIATNMKGYIDQVVGLKYFALYDAAKKFLNSGEPVNRINAAFGSVNTLGTKENLAPKCTQPTTSCNPADAFSSACPVSVAEEPTLAEVLAKTKYSKLDGIPISGSITGTPFDSFKARFEKSGSAISIAGYNPSTDVSTPTGTCGFSCTYLVENACQSCALPKDFDPKDPPKCGTAPDCGPCECVKGFDTKSQSCSGTTKIKTVKFTFLVDAFEKYSSEDSNGLVPSTSLNNVEVVAKQLPYDTLKFNYMMHSCTVIRSGTVSTELKEDAVACQLDAALTPV